MQIVQVHDMGLDGAQQISEFAFQTPVSQPPPDDGTPGNPSKKQPKSLLAGSQSKMPGFPWMPLDAGAGGDTMDLMPGFGQTRREPRRGNAGASVGFLVRHHDDSHSSAPP